MSEDGFAETTVESSEEVGSHEPDVDIYAIRVGCLFALPSSTENATVSTQFVTLREIFADMVEVVRRSPIVVSVPDAEAPTSLRQARVRRLDQVNHQFEDRTKLAFSVFLQ